MLRYYVVLVSAFISSVATQLQPEQNAAVNYKNVQLLPFMRLAHGLRSGPITILDSSTVFIEDLHYDGKGPDAHFWVGKGPWPFDNGTLVPDENGSKESLQAYTGQNVTIKLPSNVTIDQVDYLSVWCITYKHNFGHTFFRRKVPGRSLGERLEPLKELAHGVRSGPIVAVDQKTLFLPNLHYDGVGPDVHFWAGKGNEPSSSGILVKNETGGSASLLKYQGQSVYITLPFNVTTNDIDYFSIWSVQDKQNYGHTLIPKNGKIPAINGNPLYASDNSEIVRVKKCCPVGQVLQKEGCSPSNQQFNLTVNLRESTDSYAIKNVTYEPFVQPVLCEHKTYPLDPKEDDFLLLRNGSLAVLDTNQIHSMDEYCFETVNFKEDDKDRWETTPFLCISSSSASMSKSTFVLYGAGILLSAAFLIITAFVYVFTKKPCNARDKCIMLYSSSMAVVFVSLVAVQFSTLDETSCVVVAYVIQFFLVSSFTWLTLISTETLFKIIYYNNDAYTLDRRRFTVYLSIGTFVPMFAFAVSFLVDQTPDIPTIVLKQQFGENECWFEGNEPAYVYVPIAIAIITNATLGIIMKVRLLRLARKHRKNIAWIALQNELKLMFRSGCLLFTVMTVCWVAEIVSLIVGSGESIWLAIDIINSVQGLIVFFIFVVHPSVRGKICKGMKPHERNSKAEEKPLRVLDAGEVDCVSV